MLKLRTLTILNAGQDVKLLKHSEIGGRHVNQYNHLGKQLSIFFFYKIKRTLMWDPVTPALDIYLTEMNASVHTKTYTKMFKAAYS